MASGMPSSARQMRCTIGRVRSSRTKSGSTRAARSANSSSASPTSSATPAVRGGMTRTRSPGTPSGSRLVATIEISEHAPSSSAATAAAASMTCSQLSSTTTARQPHIAAMTADMGSVATAATPIACASVAGTIAGSVTPASSISHGPSGSRGRSRRTDSSASRVLPAPPTPVRVSRRAVEDSRCTCSSCAVRPTNVVSGIGTARPADPSSAVDRTAGAGPISSSRSGPSIVMVTGVADVDGTPSGSPSSRSGSCCSTARWMRCTSGPGSIPRVSARTARRVSKRCSASACRWSR